VKAWILLGGVLGTLTAAFGQPFDRFSTDSSTSLVFTEGEVVISPSENEVTGPWSFVDEGLQLTSYDSVTLGLTRFQLWIDAVADDELDDCEQLLELGEELDPFLADDDDDPLFTVTNHLHRQARDAVITLFDELCVVADVDEETGIDLSSDFRGNSEPRKKKKAEATR